MEKADISVAIAAFNEAKNIAKTLGSVAAWVGEIIVVDGGSADDTVAIAKSFGAKVIKTTNPPIFHLNKQKALDACQKSWILQLDADEVIGDRLRQEILKVVGDSSSVNGYAIARRNYFLGHWLRKGGQYPDYVIRLFRRGKGSFPSKSVHEQIVIDGEVKRLSEPMDHFSTPTREDYWRKANSYIALSVSDMKAKKVPKGIGSLFRYTVYLPLKIFLELTIRHKGILDGLPGIEFAYYSALHPAIAYFRYARS